METLTKRRVAAMPTHMELTRYTEYTEDRGTYDEADNDRKHACGQCSAKYKMRRVLLRYLKIVHKLQNMFMCQYF